MSNYLLSSILIFLMKQSVFTIAFPGGIGLPVEPNLFADDDLNIVPFPPHQQAAPPPLPPVRNFITIATLPTKIGVNFTLEMTYQCNRDSVVTLMVDGYLDQDPLFRDHSNPLLVYDPNVIARNVISCRYSPHPQRSLVSFRFPQAFVRRPSILMPKPLTLYDVKLKGFMLDKKTWNSIRRSGKQSVRNSLHAMFQKSTIKFQVPIASEPPQKRDVFLPDRCMSWQLKLLNEKLIETPKLKSPVEEECYDLVKFPIVMSEEPYGVIKPLSSFRNNEMVALARLKRLRLTFHSVFYLISYCKTNKICSIVQHITHEEKMETPAVLINDEGRLHIQMMANDNQSYAHLTPWSVPVRQWVKLNIHQANSLINVTLQYGENFEESHNFIALFQVPIKFKYDDGFLTLGGTVFCRNSDAIVAHARLCRNKLLTVQKQFSAEERRMLSNLEKNFKREDVIQKIAAQSYKMHHHRQRNVTDVCRPYFLELIKPHKEEMTCKKRQPITAKIERFSTLDSVLRKLPGNLSLDEARDHAMNKLSDIFLDSLNDIVHLSNITDRLLLLKQAAKLGDGLSHYYLYVVYKNGLGTKSNKDQARYHLLSGAHLGDRLCLKTLGYHHLKGTEGFPRNFDLSIYYYLNAAHKTQKDLAEHSAKQTTVNIVRLTDEKQMKQQLDEEEGMFQWIKHQAEKGVYSAQRNMGRLLYWGQQGLQRNLEEAFKYYEEAAKGGDPEAVYDYGVVLLKGHGAKEDVSKAIGLLRTAAESNNHPAAFNTLGWYYSTKEINHTKAVEYFEKADELGNVDAAYNLGHMYHLGQYPNRGKDLKKAFLKYFRAAKGGHVESCLQVSYLYTTGIKDFLPANPYFATQWAKFLSEKNPIMGEVIRQALQAYRKKFWAKAIFLYLAVAETGFEVASFNTAFLCEQNKDSIEEAMEKDCIWRFWNESANHPAAHPYAQNKMGDFYYYGIDGTPDLPRALSYYGKAAAINDTQALFNVASLLEKHPKVQQEDLQALALPIATNASREDVIVQLYSMCSASMSDDTVLPCYMALIRLKLSILWKNTPLYAKLLTVMIIVASTIIVVTLQKQRERRDKLLLAELEMREAQTSSLMPAGDVVDPANGTAQRIRLAIPEHHSVPSATVVRRQDLEDDDDGAGV